MLDALGIGRAHIVGVSYSAAVALQLAADAPYVVHTLALLEPPPVHTPSAAQSAQPSTASWRPGAVTDRWPRSTSSCPLFGAFDLPETLPA